MIISLNKSKGGQAEPQPEAPWERDISSRLRQLGEEVLNEPIPKALTDVLRQPNKNEDEASTSSGTEIPSDGNDDNSSADRP